MLYHFFNSFSQTQGLAVIDLYHVSYLLLSRIWYINQLVSLRTNNFIFIFIFYPIEVTSHEKFELKYQYFLWLHSSWRKSVTTLTILLPHQHCGQIFLKSLTEWYMLQPIYEYVDPDKKEEDNELKKVWKVEKWRDLLTILGKFLNAKN